MTTAIHHRDALASVAKLQTLNAAMLDMLKRIVAIDDQAVADIRALGIHPCQYPITDEARALIARVDAPTTDTCVHWPAVGAPCDGGFFAGVISSGGANFALIVAPREGGEITGQWLSTRRAVPGALSRCDGAANTAAMHAAGSEIAQWATGLSLNGYRDWYVPSVDELELMYRNFKPGTASSWSGDGKNSSSVPPGATYGTSQPRQTAVPSFVGGSGDAFSEAWYWSSTQYAGNESYAWGQGFDNGGQDLYVKSYAGRVRAVRRLPIGTSVLCSSGTGC